MYFIIIAYINVLVNLYEEKVSTNKNDQGLRLDLCWNSKGLHQFQAPLATQEK